MAKRKNYSPDFKAKVALAALSNEKTVAELSMEHGLHQNLINNVMRTTRTPASIWQSNSTRICSIGGAAN